MAAQGKKGGRKPGALGYSVDDTTALFHCVESVLPQSNEDWEMVWKVFCDTHASINKRPMRNPVSLKGHFGSFLAVKKKTGSSTKPEDIDAAWRIQRLIHDKQEFATIDDDDEDKPVAPLSPGPRASSPQQHRALSPQRPPAPTITISGGSDSGDAEEEKASQAVTPQVQPVRSSTNGQRCAHDGAGQPTSPGAATARPPAIAARIAAATRQRQAGKRKADSTVTMAGAIKQHLSDQTRNREVSQVERVLTLQLQEAKDAKQHERTERLQLLQKVDRLEATITTLREQKETNRDRLMTLQIENASLRSQLMFQSAPHGYQRPPYAATQAMPMSPPRHGKTQAPYARAASPVVYTRPASPVAYHRKEAYKRTMSPVHSTTAKSASAASASEGLFGRYRTPSARSHQSDGEDTIV